MMCPDCVACVAAMKERNMEYEFYDFKDSLLYMKEFLKMRDSLEIFEDVKINGKIGIPCLVLEDESVTLDWQSVME